MDDALSGLSMTAGPGHNRGPTMEPGTSWRRFAWTKARTDLMPVLPIEVVRLRVRRARELGLPYKTYAGVRAHTGQDVIGFLFSSNALRLLRHGDVIPAARADRLAALVGATRLALMHPPLAPDAVLESGLIDRAAFAPSLSGGWPAMRDRVVGFLRETRQPADGFLVIGDTALEREWAEAGRTAGFLTAERYFGADA